MEEFEGLATGFIEEHGVNSGKAGNLLHDVIHLVPGFALLPPRLSHQPLGKEGVEGAGHGFRVAGIDGRHAVGKKIGESTMESFDDLLVGDWSVHLARSSQAASTLGCLGLARRFRFVYMTFGKLAGEGL
jgi:hypothetical protein